MPEFKKSGKRRNVRKKQESSSEDDDVAGSQVIRGEKRQVAPNPLKAQSFTIKKPRKVIPEVESARTLLPEVDSGATRIVEIDTEADKDATAILKRNIENARKQNTKEEYKEVYKGSGQYQQFYEQKDSTTANAGGGKLKPGPIRAPDHLRATVRWDYAPDICKDYKETGFCGFGDSCKFMHDRSDYKSGWQLEREWAANEYGKRDNENYEVSDSDEDDDGVPFACYICRNEFVNPVVTKCKHYFCEACALKRFKKTKKCFVCDASTGGIFNTAHNIIAKQKKKEEEEVMSRNGIHKFVCTFREVTDARGNPGGDSVPIAESRPPENHYAQLGRTSVPQRRRTKSPKLPKVTPFASGAPPSSPFRGNAEFGTISLPDDSKHLKIPHGVESLTSELIFRSTVGIKKRTKITHCNIFRRGSSPPSKTGSPVSNQTSISDDSSISDESSVSSHSSDSSHSSSSSSTGSSRKVSNSNKSPFCSSAIFLPRNNHPNNGVSSCVPWMSSQLVLWHIPVLLRG